MMKAKLDMLKELISQMQVLMAEGEGDSSEAGEEAMESLAKPEEEASVSEEAMKEPEEDKDDIKAAVKAAFKPKLRAPLGKGAVMVMESKAVGMPMKKKGKGLKYG